MAATSSGYHATLVADGESFHLLTSGAAYRLEPRRAPFETRLDLGFGAWVTASSLLFWSDGAVQLSPKPGGPSDGPARRVVALPDRPQLFVATGETPAWLVRSGDRFSLETSAGDQRRTLYSTRASIDAVAGVGDWIFFVERPAGSDWRIGRVAFSGGPVAFTPERKGRAPAMLAGRRDVVYYDGDHFEVRRLSLDLHRDETLARGIICSPLAVAERVYCAQVEGIVELRNDGAPRRIASTPRSITAIAASATRLVWVIDAGADRLEVRSLELPAESNANRR